jgi:hypothetical protein
MRLHASCLQNFGLYNVFYKLTKTSKETPGEFWLPVQDPSYKTVKSLFSKNLQAIINLAQNHNSAVLLVTQVYRPDSSLKNQRQELNNIIKKAGAINNVPIADPMGLFQNLIDKKTRTIDDLFIDEVHPTIEGQALIAQTIMDVIKENKLFLPIDFKSVDWQKVDIEKNMARYKKELGLTDTFMAKAYARVAYASSFYDPEKTKKFIDLSNSLSPNDAFYSLKDSLNENLKNVFIEIYKKEVDTKKVSWLTEK